MSWKPSFSFNKPYKKVFLQLSTTACFKKSYTPKINISIVSRGRVAKNLSACSPYWLRCSSFHILGISFCCFCTNRNICFWAVQKSLSRGIKKCFQYFTFVRFIDTFILVRTLLYSSLAFRIFCVFWFRYAFYLSSYLF